MQFHKTFLPFHLVLMAAIGLAPAFISGCSFSYSSESISRSSNSSSDSVNNSSESSSSSSAADDDRDSDSDSERKDADQDYSSDVRDYTVAYLHASDSDLDGFQSGLGRIAGQRGITNWEEDRLTYVGIGRGLAKTGINSAELTAYSQNFGGGDATRIAIIEEAYHSAN